MPKKTSKQAANQANAQKKPNEVTAIIDGLDALQSLIAARARTDFDKMSEFVREARKTVSHRSTAGNLLLTMWDANNQLIQKYVELLTK